MKLPLPILKLLKILGASFIVFSFAISLIATAIWIVPVIWMIEKISPKNGLRMKIFVMHGFKALVWGLQFFRIMKIDDIKGSLYNKGSCIIIANHPGFFDTVILMSMIPKLSVLVNGSVVKKGPFRALFKLAGYICSSGKDVTPLTIIDDAIKVIQKGSNFLLFPEGTRSPVGGLNNFKSGAFTIALKSNVPIQPVLIKNDPPCFPKGTWLFNPQAHRSSISIELLDIIEPSTYVDPSKQAKDVEKMYKKLLFYV